jgi:hypothetical protein
MYKTIFTRIINTGLTNSVYVNYQRASDKMWQYQVELKPGQPRNIWFVENTFETFSDNPTIEYVTYYPFPLETTRPVPGFTPTPTPSNTKPPVNTPTPTPSNTETLKPTPTPTPSTTETSTPTPTPTPSSTLPTQNILDAILTDDNSYISVGNNKYLKFINP